MEDTCQEFPIVYATAGKVFDGVYVCWLVSQEILRWGQRHGERESYKVLEAEGLSADDLRVHIVNLLLEKGRKLFASILVKRSGRAVDEFCDVADFLGEGVDKGGHGVGERWRRKREEAGEVTSSKGLISGVGSLVVTWRKPVTQVAVLMLHISTSFSGTDAFLMRQHAVLLDLHPTTARARRPTAAHQPQASPQRPPSLTAAVNVAPLITEKHASSIVLLS